MKIAFYIEDGLEQIVLTPETETEKGIVSKMHDGSREMNIYQGGFYECRGGWVRQGLSHDSTIVVLRKRETQPEPRHSAAPTDSTPPLKEHEK